MSLATGDRRESLHKREDGRENDSNIMNTTATPFLSGRGAKSYGFSSALGDGQMTPINVVQHATPTSTMLTRSQTRKVNAAVASLVPQTITFADGTAITSPPRTRASSITRRSPTRVSGKRIKATGTNANESTAKKSYKSLQRLKQSNAILERVLAEQREKEQHLESNLKFLETTLRRTKDTQLRETVRTLNSSLFLLLVAGLLWGNWVMFSPHLDAMIMACLVSAVLRDFQLSTIHILDHLQKKMEKYVLRSTALISMATLGTGFLSRLITGSLMTSLLTSSSLVGAAVAIRYSSARALSATMLTLVITVALCAPIAFLIRTCGEEMELTAKFMFDLMENKGTLLEFVEKLNKVKFVRWSIEQTQLGRDYLVPEDLTEFIKSAAGAFSANSALNLVTDASNLLWAFGTFMATLFSLLQVDWDRLWTTHLARFSPLPSSDNFELYTTIRSSTWQVFAGSASVGAVHGIMTYVALRVVGSPLSVLPAVASSCLAVAPFFGSWLPLVPFVLGYLIMERELEAFFIASMQILAIAVLSPWLTSSFPASAKFIGGLPIVAGLFAWGVCGILYGPLIVGLSIVTANIYLRYTLAFRPVSHSDVGDEYAEEEGSFEGSGFYSSPRPHFDASFLSAV